MVLESYGFEDTKKIGKTFGEKAYPGSIFCLCGDLGAGKTVFAQGFAQGMGIQEDVTSPTFTIINEYQGRLPLYHFDLYRINSGEELEDTGYDDYFFGKGVCVIEWPDIAYDFIPSGAYYITIERDYQREEDYRKITVVQKGGKNQ